jgi:HEAT repeat protein
LGQEDSIHSRELLNLALNDMDSDVRTMAIISLSRNNDQNAISLLNNVSFNQGGQVQQAAILSLADLDSSEATDFLLRSLRDLLHSDIRYAAMKALANRVSLPEVEEAFIYALKYDSDPLIRQRAAFSLADVYDSQVKDALVFALNDPDSLVKQAAILSVTPYADLKILDKIKMFLYKSDLGVRQAAILSLGSRLDDFPQNIYWLTLELLYSDPQVRLTAVSVLGANMDKFPELKQPFLNIAQDIAQPVEIRQKAMLSLSKINAPEVEALFVDNLDNINWEIRQSAALGLGNFSSVGIPELLEPLTQDSAWQVRQATAISLGNFNQSQTIDYLKPLLNDDNWQVRLVAVYALGPSMDEFPELKQPFLDIANNASESVEMRQEAMLSLGNINAPEVKDLFINNLDNIDWRMRQVAALGLGNFKGAEVPRLLEPLIQDSVWQVRESAVVSLGKFNELGAVESIIPLLRDSNVYVRQAAVLSLGDKVGAYPQLTGEFVNILKTDSDSWVQEVSAFSLQSLNTPEVEEVRPLIQQRTSELKVAVVIQGVDDGLGYFPWTKRNLATDDVEFNSWPLIKILEAGGVQVIKYRWSGNLVGEDFRKAQLGLDDTIISALDLSKGGRIGIIPYSGGNYIAERLFEPDLSVNITEAFAAGKIHIISLGNPSTYNFGILDSDWRNVWSRSDLISEMSARASLDIYDVNFSNLSHFSYEDPRVISYIGYNMFGWKYTPTTGSWPGSYNFNSIAPQDYYLQQQMLSPQSTIITDSSFLFGQSNFNSVAPLDYWEHQQLQQFNSELFQLQSPINSYQWTQQYQPPVYQVPYQSMPAYVLPYQLTPPSELFNLQPPINNYQPFQYYQLPTYQQPMFQQPYVVPYQPNSWR